MTVKKYGVSNIPWSDESNVNTSVDRTSFEIILTDESQPLSATREEESALVRFAQKMLIKQPD